jgi:DNA (cytosine-5)-methyltransferase 1
MKPRLLDLFCGEGGAGAGYHRAGFEVVGVDIHPQPNYPFKFWRFDALEILARHTLAKYGLSAHERAASRYDAIHASPPCQAYTTMSNRHGSNYPMLIADVRALLEATGLAYVIENVAGARRELRDPLRLTGEMFGLGVHRPRLFETNWPLMGVLAPSRQPDPVAVYGKNDQRRLWTRADGSELRAATLEEARAAMEMPWASWDGCREAIPPAYTEFIGHQLLAHVGARSAA